jgi:hypothetical protein
MDKTEVQGRGDFLLFAGAPEPAGDSRSRSKYGSRVGKWNAHKLHPHDRTVSDRPQLVSSAINYLVDVRQVSAVPFACMRKSDRFKWSRPSRSLPRDMLRPESPGSRSPVSRHPTRTPSLARQRLISEMGSPVRAVRLFIAGARGNKCRKIEFLGGGNAGVPPGTSVACCKQEKK